MLKFISSVDSSYEDSIYREFNIPKDSNLNEFFSNLQYNNLINILKQLAEKSEIKDPKKAEDFKRGKLTLLFSVFATQRNYHSDINTKNALNKIVELIHQFAGDNKFKEINLLEDMYYLLPNNELKVDLLVKILGNISSDEGLFRSNKSRLEEIVNDFINFDYGKENIMKFYVELYMVLQINKNFEFMHKIISKFSKFFNENFSESSKRPELLKIHFFNLFNKLSTTNFNYDLNTFNSCLNKLPQESKLVDAILKNNLKEVNDFDITYFKNTYGSADHIIINAKLRIIYQILSSYLKGKSNNQISFEILEKDLKVSVEDIEEVIFEADELNIFKLVIDYERSILLIKYVRKFGYGKQELDEMKSKIHGLRYRLKGFAMKIDRLILSE